MKGRSADSGQLIDQSCNGSNIGDQAEQIEGIYSEFRSIIVIIVLLQLTLLFSMLILR